MIMDKQCFLRISQVKSVTGLPNSTIYARILRGLSRNRFLLDHALWSGWNPTSKTGLPSRSHQQGGDAPLFMPTHQPASPSTNRQGESVPVPAWQLLLGRGSAGRFVGAFPLRSSRSRRRVITLFIANKSTEIAICRLKSSPF